MFRILYNNINKWDNTNILPKKKRKEKENPEHIHRHINLRGLYVKNLNIFINI